MEINPLRVVIAGYGWFGKMHHEVWEQIPEVQVVAIVDPNPNCLSVNKSRQDDFHSTPGKFATKAVPELPRFDTLDDLIKNVEFDFLDIVAPEEDHFPLAMRGLQLGKAVFVEKPFSTDPAHSLRLLELSKPGKLFVGHILRFDKRYRAVKARLAVGERIITASLSRDFQRSALDVYGRVHPVFAALTHDIDLAVWLFGKPPRSAFAMANSELGRAYPDALAVLLRWDDGRIATIRNSWHLARSCPFGFTFSSVFIGNVGTYSIQNQPDIEIWDDELGVNYPELFFWPLEESGRSGALYEELRDAALCALRSVESNIVSVMEAHNVICISEAILKSCKSGQEEEVLIPFFGSQKI